MDATGSSACEVSIIIPVRDAARAIDVCLKALLHQTFPASATEIIVVDNGSSDGTDEVVARYPVTLLVESSTPSPYAARNAGMAAARGAIVAFTDASCVPAGDWIEQGLRALSECDADLAGGEIRFTMSDPPALGEIADAILNVDVAASIAAHRACMTGNLFVRRRVLEAIGPFDSRIRSGGDMRWTRKASDAGYRLVYAPSAVVSYPARGFGPLLRKQYRVGRGVPGVLRSFGTSRLGVLVATARAFLPMPPHRLPPRARRRVGPLSPARMAATWLVIWLAKVARATGSCRALLSR